MYIYLPLSSAAFDISASATGRKLIPAGTTHKVVNTPNCDVRTSEAGNFRGKLSKDTKFTDSPARFHVCMHFVPRLPATAASFFEPALVTREVSDLPSVLKHI